MPEGQIDATLRDWETIAERIRDPDLRDMIRQLLGEHRDAGEGDEAIMGIVFFDDDIAAVQLARGKGTAVNEGTET